MVQHQTSQLAKAAPAGVVLRGDGAAAPAFCRRAALHWGNAMGSVRCSAGQPRANSRPAQGGRGAVGRALCFRNRALRPGFTLGLLRGVMAGPVANGTDVMRDLAGSGDAFMGGAGASAMGVLIRSTRAVGRASPTQWGTPAPEPCENELPAHAPNSFDRRDECLCLHVRTAGRGHQKLRH